MSNIKIIVMDGGKEVLSVSPQVMSSKNDWKLLVFSLWYNPKKDSVADFAHWVCTPDDNRSIFAKVKSWLGFL